MRRPKISLIVPVYNAEKYLRRCLDSLAQQTLRDIEVLMVDNASADGSRRIMDEFAARDGRFTALFKRGGLAGGARNEGLKRARGEYVSFVDSDDWLAPSFCADLYEQARNQNADIACCHLINTDESGSVFFPPDFPPETLKTLGRRQNAPSHFMDAACRHGVPWRKIIRRELITRRHLTFPENTAYEDLAFITACFLMAETAVFTDKPLYVYRRRKGNFSSCSLQRDPGCVFASFSHVRGPLQEAGIYGEIKENFEYYVLEIICGGEAGGNGLLKRASKEQKKAFFNQSRDFYRTLPVSFFKNRNIIFRVKYALLRAAMHFNAPVLPVLYRVPLNIFTTLCLPLARPRHG